MGYHTIRAELLDILVASSAEKGEARTVWGEPAEQTDGLLTVNAYKVRDSPSIGDPPQQPLAQPNDGFIDIAIQQMVPATVLVGQADIAPRCGQLLVQNGEPATFLDSAGLMLAHLLLSFFSIGIQNDPPLSCPSTATHVQSPRDRV